MKPVEAIEAEFARVRAHRIERVNGDPTYPNSYEHGENDGTYFTLLWVLDREVTKETTA